MDGISAKNISNLSTDTHLKLEKEIHESVTREVNYNLSLIFRLNLPLERELMNFSLVALSKNLFNLQAKIFRIHAKDSSLSTVIFEAYLNTPITRDDILEKVETTSRLTFFYLIVVGTLQAVD